METRIYETPTDDEAARFARAARKAGLGATKAGRNVTVTTTQGLQRATLATVTSRYSVTDRGLA